MFVITTGLVKEYCCVSITAHHGQSAPCLVKSVELKETVSIIRKIITVAEHKAMVTRKISNHACK